MGPTVQSVRNVLLVRTDRLGDLLMNLPLIHRIKQNYPAATLTLIWSSVNCSPPGLLNPNAR